MNFTCQLCNKEYKSYQSFWNHHFKNHKEQQIKVTKPNDNKERNFECNFCGKKFTTKNNMLVHIEKTCKHKIDKTILLERKLAELQNEINNLKSTPNTTNNTTNNNTTNNNTTTNNGTINNIIVINKIGTENIADLNDAEVKDIFNQKLESVVKFVQHLNFNERLPFNHNFCSTTLEGGYLTVYNTDECKQEKDRKKYFFEDLLCRSINKMEQLYYKYKYKFRREKQNQIEEDIRILKTIRDRTTSDKILMEMLKKLNLLSYNYRQTVLNTWKNGNVTGKHIPKTFDEELMMERDDSDIKDIENIFLKPDESDGTDLFSSEKETEEEMSSERIPLVRPRRKTQVEETKEIEL